MNLKITIHTILAPKIKTFERNLYLLLTFIAIFISNILGSCIFSTTYCLKLHRPNWNFRVPFKSHLIFIHKKSQKCWPMVWIEQIQKINVSYSASEGILVNWFSSRKPSHWLKPLTNIFLANRKKLYHPFA